MKKYVFFIFTFVITSFSLYAQQEPDRGQYVMTIIPKSVTNWGNGESCDNSYFSIRARYYGKSGEVEIPESNIRVNLDGGKTKTSFPVIPPFIFSVDNKVEKLIFHAKRKHHEWGKCVNFREGENILTVSSSYYPCSDRTITQGDNGKDVLDGDGSFKGVFNIKVRPVSIRLFFQDTNLAEGNRDSYALPSGRKVRIKATTGFPKEVYKWQYRKGSDNWQSFPDPLISSDGMEIAFSGDDLLEVMEIYNKIPVEIRISGSCVNSENVISLQPRPSGPGYLRTDSIIGERCVNSKDGMLYLTLSRKLLDNEFIWVESVKKDGSNNVLPLSVKKIAADRYLVYDLASGNYTFGITGYYIDQYNREVPIDVVGDDYYFEGFIPPAQPLDFSIVGAEPLSCVGGNNGRITVKPGGGSGYWRVVCKNEKDSIFQTEFQRAEAITIFGLPGGTYNVWIEDSNGCTLKDYPDEVRIEDPSDPFRIDRTEFFRPMAGKTDGAIEIQVIQGIPPFKVIWKHNNSSGAIIPQNKIQSLGEGGAISRLEGVAGGNYYVMVTDSLGCYTDSTLILEELPPFEMELIQNKAIPCYGESAGELEIHVESGGVPPYTYEWFRFENPYRYPVGTGTILSGIPAGRYQVKVTDSAGNEIWTSLIEQTQGEPVEVEFRTEMLRCYGDRNGFLEAELSGGNAPYSYRWMTGNPAHTGLRIDNLIAGDYGLEVIDSKGCKRTVYGTIAQPAELSLSEKISNPSCARLENGSIVVNVTGGTAPYQIEWSTGEQTEQITNLAAGNYNVRVADSYTCKVIEKQYKLTEPQSVSLAVKQIKPVSAFGKKDGSAAFYVQGGIPPYTITCSSANGLFHVTRTIQSSGNVPALVEFVSLPEDSYVITARDAQFNSSQPDYCVAVESFQITEPPLLEVTIEESRHISCYKGDDGQLTARASGGVPMDGIFSYHYKWYRVDGGKRILLQEVNPVLGGLPYGQYQVEVMDQNGVSVFSAPYTLLYPAQLQLELTASVLKCSSDRTGWVTSSVSGGSGDYTYRWSTGATTPSIENTEGGTYTLTVTDARGCLVTGEAEITSPSPLFVDYEIRDPLCTGRNDGMISLNVGGGTAPYTYRWSGGTGDSSLDNLSSGKYQVVITDAQGCWKDTAFILSDPDPVSIIQKELIAPKAFGYSDGSLSVEVIGGIPPYQLFWTDKNGNSLESDTVKNEQGNLISSIRNIPEGTYYLRVEDMNYSLLEASLADGESCACTQIVSFYVPEPPLLEVELECTRDIRCYGTGDGELTAHARGGVPFTEGLPYRYRWYKDGLLMEVTDSITGNLNPGEYAVQIIDANGIEVNSLPVVLTQPDSLKLNFSAADLRCSRDVNGWVEVEASGGTTPYVFSWSTGDTTRQVKQIPRGKYFVWVKDNHGCETSGNVSIIQPDGIKVSVEMTEPTCYGASDGTIRLHVSGGQPPYRHEWNNGDRSLFHRGLSAGAHSITIIDANECSYEVFTYDLKQPDSLIINLGEDRVLCRGQQLELNATVPEPVQSYTWYDSSSKPVASGPFISLEQAGTYRVEVLTAKGCKGAGQVTVTRDDREIAAEFVVASRVPIYDEVLVVNISNPTPDGIEWILPGESGDFEVIQSDDSFLSLFFHAYGEYRIGMKSRLGKCEKIIFKTIQVMDKEDIPDYEDEDEPQLKQFLVSPNPNRGDFSVKLELREASPVVLQLVNSGTGQIVEKRYLQGAKQYDEQFHLQGIRKGTFVLNAYSPKVKIVQKIIVH